MRVVGGHPAALVSTPWGPGLVAKLALQIWPGCSRRFNPLPKDHLEPPVDDQALQRATVNLKVPMWRSWGLCRYLPAHACQPPAHYILVEGADVVQLQEYVHPEQEHRISFAWPLNARMESCRHLICMLPYLYIVCRGLQHIKLVVLVPVRTT